MSGRLPRVVHIAKFYPPVGGGMERVVAMLCAATRERVESRVVAYNDGHGTVRERVGGVPVARLRTIRFARSTPIAPSLVRELRALDADVVVLHEPNPWALLACALARPKQPLSIWFHSEVVRPRLQYTLFYHPLVKAVYDRAASIIVSSPALAEHAAALRPYGDRVEVIPFGIDTALWSAAPPGGVRASAVAVRASGRPIVLFAGRMVAYKGVGVLLEALVSVNAYAVIVGDGPLRAAWQRAARDLNIEERVEFPGEVTDDELRALYGCADVFVLPSVTRAEAFGYVQLEAMAAGLPVISTRLPSGVPWVNQHGVTGLTVPPGDAPALAAALRDLLGDAAMKRRMSAAARARVASEFTLERMGERASALFTRLAARETVPS
ncbi:MAG TPA: glycosyltransferase [Vicinamibacterales bacterium]|nr:glycosyltransferase [Vicinamibacterales bacterium]